LGQKQYTSAAVRYLASVRAEVFQFSFLFLSSSSVLQFGSGSGRKIFKSPNIAKPYRCRQGRWTLQNLYLMKYLLSVFIMLLVYKNCFSQQQPLYIGITQVNLAYNRERDATYKLDSLNPEIVLLHFTKIGQTWKGVYEIDSFYKMYSQINNFGIFFRGKRLSSNSGVIDTAMYRIPYFEFPYHLKNSTLPRIGNKSTEFAGEFGFKFFRPLLISNCVNCKKANNIRYRKPTPTDKTQVSNFLISEAKKLSLGDISSNKGLVEKVTKVLVISDSCKIVVANINLNMYCYSQKIPFDSTETDDSRIWFSEESQAIAYRKKTWDCYFLITKNSAQYIGHSMQLLDHADFDNDGYDEIVFRQDIGDNYAGYVMITNKLTDVFNSGWGFH
jgi:hypothetical protein